MHANKLELVISKWQSVLLHIQMAVRKIKVWGMAFLSMVCWEFRLPSVSAGCHRRFGMSARCWQPLERRPQQRW